MSPDDLVIEAVSEIGPRTLIELGEDAPPLTHRLAGQLRVSIATAGTHELEDLPFGDGSFDCAVAPPRLLAGATSVDRALGEVARVLRPGGRLVALTGSERGLAEFWLLRHFTLLERRATGNAVVWVAET